jgi:DNA polymerase III delta subunit
VSDTPELKPVYLLTGSDRPKIEVALERLRRHFEHQGIELLSALDTSGADVVAHCNAGNIFGDTRLVVVDAVDGRPNSDNRLTGGWKAADTAAIVEYLGSPAPGTTLALVAAETRVDSPLGKACKHTGDVLEFNVAKKALQGWVVARFRQAGVPADPDACAALLYLVGEDDKVALATEIDKLIVWSRGEPVDERVVHELVAPRAETPSFALTDAWAEHRAGAALEATETIFERSDRTRRDEVARLAATLGSHAAKLKTARRLAAEGVRPPDALAQLGTRSTYYAGKLFQQSERFADDELRGATERLADLDLALKGNSKLDGDLELQRALVDISRPPGRSGLRAPEPT